MTTTTGEADQPVAKRAPAWRQIDPLVLLWLVLPVVAWAGRGFHTMLRRDAGLYVYAGQLVLDGEPPYEAVFNRAGPLAHLLPALGIWLGRLIGISDVVADRILFFALTALCPVVAYLTTRVTYRSRAAGCVAAGTMVAFEALAGTATIGPDSKQPMILFVGLAVLLAVQRRMLLAGVVAGLATLTWQPALFAIVGAAIVMGLTAPGGWRRRIVALVRFGLGGLATLAVTVGYFAVVGALQAFYDGFWRANAGYTRQPQVFDHPRRVWGWLNGGFGWTVWLLVGGCVLAVLLVGWVWVRHARKVDDDPELRHRVLALAAANVGGVVWTLNAFNRSPDALVLLPMAAVAIGGTAALLWRPFTGPRLRPVLVTAVAGWVLVTTALTANLTLDMRLPQLSRSEEGARTIFELLPPDATVMSDQAPQPLALAGERSVSRYVLFGNGMRDWIDATWPGGMQGYQADLAAQAPTVLFTQVEGVTNVLRPLRPGYHDVGRGWGWRVMISREVPLPLRRRVKQALLDLRRHRSESARASD